MKFRQRLARTARALFSRGSYQAAGTAGRWSPPDTMRAPRSEGLAAFTTIGERAAYGVVNDPHLRAVLNAYCDYVIGPDGPALQYPDAAVVEAWNRRFWANCDAEGIADFGHLLRRTMR